MGRFRQKPVVIEAERWDGVHVPQFVLDSPVRTLVTQLGEIKMETLEGDMLAQIGDYIIKGIKGELYPCKPDIFEATYEKVNDGSNN